MSANSTATGRPIILFGGATGKGRSTCTNRILAYSTSVNVKEEIISKCRQLILSVSSTEFTLPQSQNQTEATLGRTLSTMLWHQPNLTNIAYHVI